MAKKVLLVDDTKTVLMFEKVMLQAAKLDLRTAGDGLEALDSVQEDRPDLILLDIMMPNLDGVSTCERLKGDPSTRDIPIIMVTTKGDNDSVERAFKAGCNDFITKPINKIELMSKVKKYLGTVA